MGRFYFPGPVLERSEGMEKEIIRTVPFLLLFDLKRVRKGAVNLV